MKKKGSYFFFLFCVIVFFACQGDGKSKVSIVRSGDVEVIQIFDPDDDSEVYLSEFVKEVKIVPLESSPECLIGKVRRIEVSDSGVYILDRHQQDRIFKFDLDGKFVGTVGTLGRSAEEYMELTDFDVEGDTVYIFDRLTDRVFVYDGNGMLCGLRISYPPMVLIFQYARVCSTFIGAVNPLVREDLVYMIPMTALSRVTFRTMNGERTAKGLTFYMAIHMPVGYRS